MHGINLACQLIVAVTMVRSSRLLCAGHIIVLDEVCNFFNLSKNLLSFK